MQLVRGDAYLRQRDEAARLEGLSPSVFAQRVADAIARAEHDPTSGALHQVEAGIVTRWVTVEGTSHAVLYSAPGDNVLRILGVVEHSALGPLRTREELIVPPRVDAYSAELRRDDDGAVETKRRHWIKVRERLATGELGDSAEHRELLIRGAALFAEVVDAEQSRRVREKLTDPGNEALAIVEHVANPDVRLELLERILFDALRDTSSDKE